MLADFFNTQLTNGDSIGILTTIVITIIAIIIIAKLAKKVLHVVFIAVALIVLLKVLGLWEYVVLIFTSIKHAIGA